jgi:hypothetical protein
MNWNNELHEFHEFLFNTSQKIRLIRVIRCLMTRGVPLATSC